MTILDKSMIDFRLLTFNHYQRFAFSFLPLNQIISRFIFAVIEQELYPLEAQMMRRRATV